MRFTFIGGKLSKTFNFILKWPLQRRPLYWNLLALKKSEFFLDHSNLAVICGSPLWALPLKRGLTESQKLKNADAFNGAFWRKTRKSFSFPMSVVHVKSKQSAIQAEIYKNKRFSFIWLIFNKNGLHEAPYFCLGQPQLSVAHTATFSHSFYTAILTDAL